MVGSLVLRRGLQSARSSVIAQLLLMDAAATDSEATPVDGNTSKGDGMVTIAVLAAPETQGGNMKEEMQECAVEAPAAVPVAL